MSAALATARKGLEAVLDFVLPPRCLSCGTEVEKSGTLCHGCWGELSFIMDPFCESCGVPLPESLPGGMICPECSSEPPPYAKARAALTYKGSVMRLVSRYKYHDQLQATLLFTGWMQLAGGRLIEEADMVVPVPLHWKRLFLRRYNQAAELARTLAKVNAKPYASTLLIRRKDTKAQASLSRVGRVANVKGAFALHPKLAKDAVKDKTILLIDDVMTTGATIASCAKVLRKAGARKVLVLTVARTTLED